MDQVSGQPGTPVRRRQSYPATPQDHNYSRQKSRELGDKAVSGMVPPTATDSGALGTEGIGHDNVAASGESDGKHSGGNSRPASEIVESKPASDSMLLKPTASTDDQKPSVEKDPKTTAGSGTPKPGGSQDPISQSANDNVKLVTEKVKPSTETLEKLPDKSAENMNVKSEAVCMDASPGSVTDSVKPTVTPDKAPSFLMTDILGEAMVEPVPAGTNPTMPDDVGQTSGLSQGHAAKLGDDSAPTQSQSDGTAKLSTPLESSALLQKPSDDSASVTPSDNKVYSEKNIHDSARSLSDELKVIPKAMETDEVFQTIDGSKSSSPETPARTTTTTTPVLTLPLSAKIEPNSELSEGKKVTEKPDLPVVDLTSPEVKPETNEAVSGAESRKEVEMECDETDPTPPGFDHPKHKQLMDQCISALSLCLSRFPQHYKSLYRLAHLYFKSPLHKVNLCRTFTAYLFLRLFI